MYDEQETMKLENNLIGYTAFITYLKKNCKKKGSAKLSFKFRRYNANIKCV